MKKILIILVVLSLNILFVGNVIAEDLDYNVKSYSTLEEFQSITGITIDK